MTGTPGGPSRHLPALTGLRFVAAFWVLVYHAMPRDELPAPVAALAGTGFLGVGIFFVLSGFILAYVYGASVRAGALSPAPFWRARFARIYPAYAAALVFAIPLFLRDVHVKSGPAGADFAGVCASTIGLLQAWIPGWGVWWNTPGWSLSVEAFFYLLFPLVAPWVLRRSIPAASVLALVCVGLTAASGTLLEGGMRETLSPRLATAVGWLTAWTPLLRLPEFVLGICAAHLYDSGVRVGAGLKWLAAAAIVGIAVASGDLPDGLAHVAGVSLGSAVFIVARAESLALGVLGRPFMVRLGNASYSLYLFHATLHSYFLAVANRTIGREWAQGWGAFAVYTVLAIALVLVVHDRIELPARRRLRGDGRTPAIAPSW